MIKFFAACLAVSIFCFNVPGATGATIAKGVHSSRPWVILTSASDASSGSSNASTRLTLPALKLHRAMSKAFNNFQPWNNCSVWKGIKFTKDYNWPESCDVGISTPVLFKKVVDGDRIKYLLVVSTSPAWGESGHATSTILSAFIFNYDGSLWTVKKFNRHLGKGGAYGDFGGTLKPFRVDKEISGFVVTEESWRMSVHTIHESIYFISPSSVNYGIMFFTLIDTKDLCAVFEKKNCREIVKASYDMSVGDEELPKIVVTEKRSKYVNNGKNTFLRKTIRQRTYIYRNGKYGLLKTNHQ